MALDTSMEKGTFTFIWKIENFSHCLQEREESLSSPVFIVDSLNKSRWSIWINPKGDDDDEYLSFYLYCCDWKTCDFAIDFQLSLLAADGSIINKAKTLGVTFDSNLLRSGSKDTYYQKEVYETKRSIYIPQNTLTVFCRLWKTNGDIGEHVQYLARTHLGVVRMSKLWSIQDFSELRLGDQRSTTVSLAQMDYTPLVLKVSLEREVQEICLKIQISREKCPDETLLSCTISVLNRYKIPFKEMQDMRKCLPNQELSWTFPKLISRRELIEGKGFLLPQDTLSLKFELTLSFGVEYEKIESIQYGSPTNLGEDSVGTWWSSIEPSPDLPPTDSETEGYLKSDLLSLYQEQTLSDFELTSEGITFPVHKTILCARSPVFKAMLTSNMQEVTTNFLNMTDIDTDTLSRMLLYVYTDTVEDLELVIASKLYYAADKYQILSLKHKCSSALKSHLAVVNVSVVLSLADRHNDDELTSAVHDFILSHAEEIMRCTEWLEFDKSNSHLAAKTMYEVFRKKLQIKISPVGKH